MFITPKFPGLCGHYSNEESDIFRLSNNKRSQSLKDFHESYTLKNQECEEQKLKKFYQENDSEEFQVGFWRYLDRF
jgi:hypothetical protein